MKRKLFNVPLSCDFVNVLAHSFLQKYAQNLTDLADVLFILPSQRAIKELQTAFFERMGNKTIFLPQMVAIGNIEQEDVFADVFDNEVLIKSLCPTINKTQRLFSFVKLIQKMMAQQPDERVSLKQAFFLANSLAKLTDTVNNEELSFDCLQNLVPEEYAEHWQKTLDFLKIITQFWPQILREKGLQDATFNQVLMLKTQAEIWKKQNTKKKIVVAGTTATFPAMKSFVKTVLELENGEVYLYGLDKHLSPEDWDKIDITHPQFELKELLFFLQEDREGVADVCLPKNSTREDFLSEVMRPAATTQKWRSVQKNTDLFSGIDMVVCKEPQEEASVISLILREALQHNKTARLVTTDRGLSRRVVGELKRWNIEVDDSAGYPLLTTPVGTFLRLIYNYVLSGFSKIETLALLKHPFCALEQDYADIRLLTRKMEIELYRKNKEDSQLQHLEQTLKVFAEPLRCLLQEKATNLSDLLNAHIVVAEKIASTSDKDGASVLWKGSDGEACAKMFADILENADALGEIETEEYIGLIEAMMSFVMIRNKYQTSEQIKILGPIEARLTQADITIVGGLNEGCFPLTPETDPWMSRGMKKDFGLPLQEKSIGILAHDFCAMTASGKVYLTRSERVDGAPASCSRWIMRMQTVIEALGGNVEEWQKQAQRYKDWAQKLFEPDKIYTIAPPSPRPPVKSRPRELSATNVEKLVRDPYQIFASKILGLKKLEDVQKDPSQADYGSIIHKILQKFNEKYPKKLPENAKHELLDLGKEMFAHNLLSAEKMAFWWPMFEQTVDWYLETEQEYREKICKTFAEQEGEYLFNTSYAPFKLTAKADRIDWTVENELNIIDYKTGKLPSKADVKNGWSPQLVVEAIIAKNNGFKNLPQNVAIGQLAYWKPKTKPTILDGGVDAFVQERELAIKKMIEEYDEQSKPYECRPVPKKAPSYSDYEHLARVDEWSAKGEEEEDDN